MPRPSGPSEAPTKTWTFFQGQWQEGNVPIMGPRTHAAWLSSCVFDGARAFEGVTPDLDRHCARINQSAVNLGLKPAVPVKAWIDLVNDGLKRFEGNAELYIRPMYWAEAGARAGVINPESTRWCLCIYELPLPPERGSAITLSAYRRPTAETAPVHAKAGCLYPNNLRALSQAHARGFDNCVMLDVLGNVAELANANIFVAKDGVVYTPVPNGSFLAGITRWRVIGLLRNAGIPVIEATMTYPHLQNADEMFFSSNLAKVAPVTRIDDRMLQPGPIYRRARELYWAFAHGR